MNKQNKNMMKKQQKEREREGQRQNDTWNGKNRSKIKIITKAEHWKATNK